MEPTTTTEASAEPDQNGGRGQPRPLQQTLIAAVVALAVGAAAGFLIGWKVEQSRVKSDVKDLKARLKAAQSEGGNPDSVQATRRVGEVTSVAPDSVTIKDTSGGDRVINLSGSTVVHKGEPGAKADLTNGATIVFSSEKATKGGADAKEIIVLPASTVFNGYEVSAVTPESLSATSSGGTRTIALADTTVVYKTTPGAAADIVQGAIIVVRDEAVSGAAEIVVLPAGSTFVA